MHKKVYTLAELANLIGGQLQGNPHCEINSIASLENAQEGQISFLAGTRYQLVTSTRYDKFLPTTKASAVILSPEKAQNCSVNKIIMEDPYQGYLQLAAYFQRKKETKPGVHPSAKIGENCEIASTVCIGPHCVIGDYCKIGENTVLEANVVIMDNTSIGADSVIYPNVTIYHDVIVGNRVVIHAGVVLGAEGFGLARRPQGWQQIPHLGSVTIGDDVLIGANTMIDRGALDDTVVENGVKLDNNIMVGHGVVIGENTVIAACAAIGGSARIGKNCMIGGASGIIDNISITDNAIFTGMSQVFKSIHKQGIYSSGTGILPKATWHKSVVHFHKLDQIVRKLRKLENQND